MIKLLVVSGTAPDDRRASAQRVEWLLTGLADHGIDTHLLVLHPTSRHKPVETRLHDKMTVFSYPSEGHPPYMQALLGKDGGFARTCTHNSTMDKAVEEGMQLVGEFEPDVIFAISRISTCEVAYRISKASGVPLIVDWHDPISLRPLTTWRSRRYYEGLAAREREWVDHAKLHIMTAASHMKIFREAYPKASVQLIPIGWSEIEGKDAAEVRPRTLLYSGTANGHAYGFSEGFPNLRPGRAIRRAVSGGRLYHTPFANEIDYKPFGLNALVGVSGVNGAASALIFRGTQFNGSTGKRLHELSMMDKAEGLPWISHHQAQAELPTAHVLWLTLAGTGSGEGEPVIACKAFSYLASGRPIVAVVPPKSETADILRGHEGVWLPDPTDVKAIHKAFEEALATPAEAHFERDVEEYRIESLADDLLHALERVLGRRPSVRRTKTGHALRAVAANARHSEDPRALRRA